MKIIYLLLLSIIITGCFGNVGSGILTNTCTKEETSDNVNSKVSVTSTFKDDIISQLVVEEVYTGKEDILESIKMSIDDQVRILNGIKGVFASSVKTDTGYTMTYTIDYGQISDDDLIELSFKKENSKNTLMLKDKEYICK